MIKIWDSVFISVCMLYLFWLLCLNRKPKSYYSKIVQFQFVLFIENWELLGDKFVIDNYLFYWFCWNENSSVEMQWIVRCQYGTQMEERSKNKMTRQIFWKNKCKFLVNLCILVIVCIITVYCGLFRSNFK